MKPTIGFIGTGVMGSSMASHLLKANYPLMVFNRTVSKTDPLVKQGATFQTPLQMSETCQIIITMLGYPQDLKDLFFKGESPLINHLKPNTIIIDHTTSSPSLAMELFTSLQEKSIFVLDVPVSGGDIGAKNGTLCSMVGGDEKILEKVRDIIGIYSKEVVHFGGAGAGQQAKCCNQIMVANNLIGVCEMLVYAYKSGVDQEKIVNLLSKGAAGNSFQLEKLAPRILNRDFEPGFYVEHFVKDLGIVLEELERMKISLPNTSLAQSFFKYYMNLGGGRQGTQGVITVLEKLNNIQK